MENWLTPAFWHQVLTETVRWFIATSPSVLVTLLLALVALKALDFWLPKLRAAMMAHSQKGGAASVEEIDKRVQTLLGIVTTLAKILVWAMVGLLVLSKVGVDVGPLIAGAGIAGLAIGFGAQELVRDVISGFFMLLENQIRTGDVAIINGTGGLVESITLRTITLRDLNGVIHVFQNGKVNTLSNMTKGWSAIVFDIGVAYKEDTDRVAEIMLTVAEELRADPAFHDKILEPMEVFGVDEFADSAVIVKARIRTRPIQQWAVGREYRRRLKKAFDAAGIEIPFPHRTVYWGAASPPVAVMTHNGGASAHPQAAEEAGRPL